MDGEQREELRQLEASDEGTWLLWILLDLEIQIASVLSRLDAEHPANVKFFNEAMAVAQSAARRANTLSSGMAVCVTLKSVKTVRARLTQARASFWRERCGELFLSLKVLKREAENFPHGNLIVDVSSLPQKRIESAASAGTLDERRREAMSNMADHNYRL
uniref:Uncharacterized protein n=1 Tax=Chromera velia CCMP2878 TaxID=1169474 RepID=A0A0G4FL95_9ALVE|eukprot:Cvel_17605.t1-p1 / transcript=Cvel_17605.t1 / gene=Cvel_17605 / organism=Chromera_velia_CCMP2878 / gene_product=hypothetical protein / transcript_product=hypothetical protein / location=Cvel_scaffold1416:4483-5415(-) / protein_length=160 / sequence_SO=supercontig / SO=protein_coding / is_pseudo=false